jgi:hypothetical protein
MKGRYRVVLRLAWYDGDGVFSCFCCQLLAVVHFIHQHASQCLINTFCGSTRGSFAPIETQTFVFSLLINMTMCSNATTAVNELRTNYTHAITLSVNDYMLRVALTRGSL